MTRVLESVVIAVIVAAGAGYASFIGVQYSVDANAEKISQNSALIKENAERIVDLRERAAVVEVRVENVERNVERATD